MLVHEGNYKGINYAIRLIEPYGEEKAIRSWYCCYFENIYKSNDFIYDEFDFGVPGGVTWNQPWGKSFGENSALYNKWVIGWDYGHIWDEGKEYSIKELEEDIFNAIDKYIEVYERRKK